MNAPRIYPASVPSVLGSGAGAMGSPCSQGFPRSPGTGQESPGTFSGELIACAAILIPPWAFVIAFPFVVGV